MRLVFNEICIELVQLAQMPLGFLRYRGNEAWFDWVLLLTLGGKIPLLTRMQDWVGHLGIFTIKL